MKFFKRRKVQELENRLNVVNEKIREIMDLVNAKELALREELHDHYEEISAIKGLANSNDLALREELHGHYEEITEIKKLINHVQLKLEEVLHNHYEEILTLRQNNGDNNQRINNLLHEYYCLLEDHNKITQSLLQTEIIRFLEQNEIEDKKCNILSWLKNNSIQMYPYEFTKEYDDLEEAVIKTETYPFIETEYGKLYFPKEWDDNHIRNYYRFLVMEQDYRSPHHYPLENGNYDIFIDAGAAEGYISLKYSKNFSRIILIESDHIWIEPLRKTFSHFENINIINKKLGMWDASDGISLHKLISSSDRICVKMDIEGYELDALKGMNGCTLSAGSRLIVCTYHNQSDGDLFQNIFAKNGIEYKFSKGYVIANFGSYQKAPYLRKALLVGDVNKEISFNVG